MFGKTHSEETKMSAAKQGALNPLDDISLLNHSFVER